MHRVLTPTYCAKVSHAQLPDRSLRSDTQVLRLIASIPLIQWKEKRHSREEKRLHVVIFFYLRT
ncbi:hypothetical protein HMPREF1121_00718 [Porphyromonas sp. KLE 1280]|nr:hypothetical protein HMPREF1121_00718 [Porphyromonas sp. KLE 1280]